MKANMKKDNLGGRHGVVSKHPKGAAKLQPGKFKMDSSEAGKRHVGFPNSEDNLPGSQLQASDPSRSGHHKLSSHEAHMLHDGHDDNEGGEADGFGEEMGAPVGPRKSAKSHRGY